MLSGTLISVSHQLSAVSSQLTVGHAAGKMLTEEISYQLSAISCQLSDTAPGRTNVNLFTSYQLSAISCQLSAVSSQWNTQQAKLLTEEISSDNS
jgi:hypothetical protein